MLIIQSWSSVAHSGKCVCDSNSTEAAEWPAAGDQADRSTISIISCYQLASSPSDPDPSWRYGQHAWPWELLTSPRRCAMHWEGSKAKEQQGR